MKNMLEKLREFPPKRILIIIAIASTITTIALFLEMRRIDALLMRSGYGIVDFELAFKQEKAFDILTNWMPQSLGLARKSLMLDFIFIGSYSICFSCMTLLLSRTMHGKIQFLGFLATFLPFTAAILDVVENILLLCFLGYVVRGNRELILLIGTGDFFSGTIIFLAGICASVKFFLLGTVFLFIVLGGGYALFRKFKSI
jgi:hypothetical protein